MILLKIRFWVILWSKRSSQRQDYDSFIVVRKLLGRLKKFQVFFEARNFHEMTIFWQFFYSFLESLCLCSKYGQTPVFLSYCNLGTFSDFCVARHFPVGSKSTQPSILIITEFAPLSLKLYPIFLTKNTKKNHRERKISENFRPNTAQWPRRADKEKLSKCNKLDYSKANQAKWLVLIEFFEIKIFVKTTEKWPSGVINFKRWYTWHIYSLIYFG